MAISEAGTAVNDERRQRKRMQNRMNQRAFRFRNAKKDKANAPKPNKQDQYQIDRWRLDEHQVCMSAPAPSKSRTAKIKTIADASTADQVLGTMIRFPLPLDSYLLHLIKYNVFRGLWENRMVLECLTIECQMSNAKQPELVCNHATFPNNSVLLPVALNQSAVSLTPTPSQMTIVHSSWINCLPFPRMRENLIKWEFDFDHSELVKDLVGNLKDLNLFLSIPSSSRRRPPLANGQTVLQEGEDGEPAAITESGLIVWGEPYRAENWEATPEFIRKWSWALTGSQELIDATNYWRTKRGENPLRLMSVDSQT